MFSHEIFSYKWVLEQCDIVDRKMQLKLIRLAKDLSIPEMEMYIFLEPLPDVSTLLYIQCS
jgi:hypothetical protein